MEDALERTAYVVGLGIEAIAIAIIVVGVVQALLQAPNLLLGRIGPAGKREVWLEFARWLVAALTFQLAADMVHTTLAPSWDEIGRVAAVAFIRTFLTLTLDRDLAEVREREAAG